VICCSIHLSSAGPSWPVAEPSNTAKQSPVVPENPVIEPNRARQIASRLIEKGLSESFPTVVTGEQEEAGVLILAYLPEKVVMISDPTKVNTIEARGAVFRLVGFDTPETGSRVRCESERTLAAAASRRLRHLIAGGCLDLEPCVLLPSRYRRDAPLQSWPALRDN
jgi:endonuclease YncB( thermonuclease family)